MLSLEAILRLLVIGQEILIAAILLFSQGSRAARVSAAMLALSAAGYLVISSPELRGTASPILPVVVLFANIVPYCLWSFARAVFEAPWPPVWVTTSFVLVIPVAWLVFANEQAMPDDLVAFMGLATRLVALILVAHSLLLALRGRPDDLVEQRRTFRIWFVMIVAAQVAVVVIVELMLGGTDAPAWLSLLNVVVIAGMTLGLAALILQSRPEFIPLETGGASLAGMRVDAGALKPADAVLCDRLMAAMDASAYRETGLTISRLAESLEHPEHQLRRLINGHLGYRNFSSFLNGYRIAEAKERLSDPDSARTPVLTIALDLGYASLGPFNRAFKEATGTTPTDYRRQNFASTAADSE